MSLPQCARCPARATVHLRATGWGAPVDVDVCSAHLDDARRDARKHTHRVETLLVDNGQDALFELGGQ